MGTALVWSVIAVFGMAVTMDRIIMHHARSLRYRVVRVLRRNKEV